MKLLYLFLILWVYGSVKLILKSINIYQQSKVISFDYFIGAIFLASAVIFFSYQEIKSREFNKNIATIQNEFGNVSYSDFENPFVIHKENEIYKVWLKNGNIIKTEKMQSYSE